MSDSKSTSSASTTPKKDFPRKGSIVSTKDISAHGSKRSSISLQNKDVKHHSGVSSSTTLKRDSGDNINSSVKKGVLPGIANNSFDTKSEDVKETSSAAKIESSSVRRDSSQDAEKSSSVIMKKNSSGIMKKNSTQLEDEGEEMVVDQGVTNEVTPKPQLQGGWADGSQDGKKKSLTNAVAEEEDERLRRFESDEDVPLFSFICLKAGFIEAPVIPDIQDILEDDLTTQMASAPVTQATRVATYKQLNEDLSKQAGLFTIDGEIDLKPLAKVLCPESEINEEDKTWDFDKLFAELSPDIQKVWDRLVVKGQGGKATIISPSTSSVAGGYQLPGRPF